MESSSKAARANLAFVAGQKAREELAKMGKNSHKALADGLIIKSPERCRRGAQAENDLIAKAENFITRGQNVPEHIHAMLRGEPPQR